MKDPKYKIGDDIIYISHSNYSAPSVDKIIFIQYIQGEWIYYVNGDNFREKDIIRKLNIIKL